MKSEIKNLQQNLLYPIYFVIFIWIIEAVETFMGLSFVRWGVLPRDTDSLISILTMPLIHGDFQHVFSNSMPLIVLGFILLQSYRKVSFNVLSIIYLLTGLLVWIAARPSYHIGASGIVYGLAFFVFASGVLRKDIRSMALSLLVVFLYGGMIWGLLPVQDGVSWEGHLFGAFSGVFAAYIYRKVDAPKPFDWGEEEEDPNKREAIYWPVDGEKKIEEETARRITVEGDEEEPAPPKKDFDENTYDIMYHILKEKRKDKPD